MTTTTRLATESDVGDLRRVEFHGFSKMPALYIITTATLLAAGIIAAASSGVRGAPIAELALAGAIGVAASAVLLPIAAWAIVSITMRRYLRAADTKVYVLEADGRVQAMIVLRGRGTTIEGIGHAKLRHPVVEDPAGSLRRDVFGRLRVDSDRDGLTLRLRAASRRLVRRYAADIPGLVETRGWRARISLGVPMHRLPGSTRGIVSGPSR